MPDIDVILAEEFSMDELHHAGGHNGLVGGVEENCPEPHMSIRMNDCIGEDYLQRATELCHEWNGRCVSQSQHSWDQRKFWQAIKEKLCDGHLQAERVITSTS